MCARFALEFAGSLPQSIKTAIGAGLAGAFEAATACVRPIIRPTDAASVVITEAQGRRSIEARFGLIPHWAKDPAIARHTFNARSETIREKPSFRDAVVQQRCLVPFSHWVEWTGASTARRALRLSLASGIGAFAGLWSSWQASKEATPRLSFTIITCPPAPSIAAVHDRMPVVLAPQDWSQWLAADPHRACQLLLPYSGSIKVQPIEIGEPSRTWPA